MGHKSNVPLTSRDFYFSPVGRSVDSGLSDENPVSTPTEAAALINALSPAPSGSNPASLTASVTGTYSNSVVVPQYATCNSRFASIVSIDPVLVDLLGRHSAEWGSLLSLSENATVVHISATQRVSIEVNALVTTGDNSVGIDVNGICDEIFIKVKLADLGGDGSVLVDHTASSATPIEYEFQGVRFMDENQTIIKYDDPVATTQTVFKIASGQAASAATSTTGALFIDLIAGNIVVRAEVISAETVARVASGGILSLDCIGLFGDTLILDGGIAIYKSIGVLFGDMEVQGSGTLQITATNVVGNVVTSGTSSLSLKADQVVGDITIGAGTTAYLIIGNLVGTLTNNGTINGIIDGVRYGNWVPYMDTVTLSNEVSETSGVYLESLQHDFVIPIAGTYKVEFLCLWRQSGSNQSIEVQFNIDNVEQTNLSTSIPKGNNGGSEARLPESIFDIYNFSAGTLDMDIKFRAKSGIGTAFMYYRRICVTLLEAT